MRCCAMILTLMFYWLTSPALAAPIKNVSARAYMVMELDGRVLLEHNSTQVRPIASITKLLVAEQVTPQLVADQLVTVTAADLANHHTKIKEGSQITEQLLLEASLIASNNSAIYALSRQHSTQSVLDAVNRRAQERGLLTIHIEEPSGLSAANRASAADLAAYAAMIKDSSISKISVEPAVRLPVRTLKSTNPLLTKPGWNFLVSKTGFTNAAGGCLLTIVEIGSRPVIVVILGSANTHTRWNDLMILRAAVSGDKFWTGNTSAPARKRYFRRPS